MIHVFIYVYSSFHLHFWNRITGNRFTNVQDFIFLYFEFQLDYFMNIYNTQCYYYQLNANKYYTISLPHHNFFPYIFYVCSMIFKSVRLLVFIKDLDVYIHDKDSYKSAFWLPQSFLFLRRFLIEPPMFNINPAVNCTVKFSTRTSFRHS